MQNLKDIIDLDVVVEKITDGQVMIRTDLELNLVGVEKAQIEEYDVQRDRISNIGVHAKDPEVARFESHSQALGQHCQMRRLTQTSSLGTVYGMSQEVTMTVSQHSVFGYNRSYITTDGVPSPSAIERRLKELATATEIREQKVGRFFNSVFTAGYYDNPVALLVVLYMLRDRVYMAEKLNQHDHMVVIPVNKVREIVNIGQDNMTPALREQIFKGPNGVGCSPADWTLGYWFDDMKQWLAGTRPEYITTDGLQSRERDPTYQDQAYRRPIKVWHMNTYDDGHSKSGKSFGEHFGFKNGKYMVPGAINKIHADTEKYLSPATYQIPVTDIAIDEYGQVWGHINCAGLTPKEVAILNFSLRGNVRVTPFLIDQDVKLDIAHGSVNAYFMDEGSYALDYTFNSGEVGTLINKLVATHRWYEDALAAQRSLKFWACQPSTETVESHWWTGVQRTLSLPKLGLKRAVFHFLLEGEAVCLSTDSLREYRIESAPTGSNIFSSLFYNTAWYWGEFMFVFNKQNMDKLIMAINCPVDNMLNVHKRADSMVSALTGKAIPVPPYSGVGTYLRGGLESNYKNIVKFGHIGIDNLTDYGYTLAGNDVYLNNVVAPGCVGLITGLGGTLLADTPYANVFTMNTAVMKTSFASKRIGMNYNDLWAFGGWNGHDTEYLHPLRKGRHKIFAANGVHIAMPPVAPVGVEAPVSYTVETVRPRKHMFGIDWYRQIDKRLTFYWSRCTSTPARDLDYHSPPAAFTRAGQIVPQTFAMAVTTVENYSAQLVAEYDYITSHFRVRDLSAGVALPVATAELQSQLPVTEEMEAVEVVAQ
ncbi:putative capsid protein [Cronartium ribicola totivirus 3]|uniref:Putative capsid protein n=1 Tax=Cronartium ribicola totivirus 3 TaxID=2687249 RepID=A0A6B9ELT0_9VIRU|nr:putative capsid protein [Cronartium ribicola totivirus 3]